MTSLHIARSALAAHPGRTFLAGLGIAIGVAAVTLLAILGTGASQRLADQLENIGKNLILIRPGTQTSDGFTPTASLTDADLDALRSDGPLQGLVRGFAASRACLGTAQYRRDTVTTTIDGVSPNAFWLRRWHLAAGRSFEDRESGQALCVLGETVRTHLWPSEKPRDALGRQLLINGTSFTVLGVLQPRGRDPLGRDHDDSIFIPLETARTRLGVAALTLAIADARPQTLEAASARIRTVLRSSHHLRPGVVDDVAVSNVREMAALGVALLDTLGLLTVWVALMAMGVGGVGVANVLLASVSSRTHEIGVRLAVGARPGHILGQFLMEALLLTMAGGFVGLALGLGVARGLADWLGWPFVVPLAYPLWALGLMVGVGLAAGVCPALAAARLDPIGALRHD
jgi:putative ABC transport system permease protein